MVAWWPTLRDLKKRRKNWDISQGCASHRVVTDKPIS
jgi:predicted transcriptional regulator